MSLALWPGRVRFRAWAAQREVLSTGLQAPQRPTAPAVAGSTSSARTELTDSQSVPSISGRVEVNLTVRDPASSAAWYSELLGLEELYDFTGEDGLMRYIALVEPKSHFVLCLVGHQEHSESASASSALASTTWSSWWIGKRPRRMGGDVEPTPNPSLRRETTRWHLGTPCSRFVTRTTSNLSSSGGLHRPRRVTPPADSDTAPEAEARMGAKAGIVTLASWRVDACDSPWRASSLRGVQPDGVTEKRLGPSGARTSRGGEPFGHGADPLRDEPSADGCVAQLGTLRLGLPERPGEFDPDPLAVGELELDGVPAGHEVTVPVGLRDPDSVPGTGTPWTAVVPPACLHCVKLPVGPDGCHAAVEPDARGTPIVPKCPTVPATLGRYP